MFYSPVCIPVMHRGEWGFLYFNWKKPPTWSIKWPVFLLIICSFCSSCYCSEALSPVHAQQTSVADSGTACIAGAIGCSGRVLWPDGLLQCVSVVCGLGTATWQMIFCCCDLTDSLCLHHHWWDLWLFITLWIRSFVNVPTKASSGLCK